MYHVEEQDMENLEENLYIFKATCTNVVDGDTIDIKLDMGFDIFANRRVRLLHVDTPERGQDNWKEATEYTRSHLEGRDILIQTYKSDSFGRYLANIFYEDDTVYKNFNQELKDTGLIKPDSKWNDM